MNSLREHDYRNKPCPKCKTIGTITLDFLTSKFKFTKCKAEIDPYAQRLLEQNTSETPPRMSVPIGDSGRDFVADTYKYVDMMGKEKEIVVSRFRVPKQNEEDTTLFDPNSPAAKFYLRLHAKRFRNRRRYLHDRQRRLSQRDSTE